MRTGNSWIWLPVLLVLFGGCADMREAPDCPARDTVTVNHKKGELSAKPECVTVREGSTLTIRLVPPKAAGNARTRAKSGGPSWLDRPNETEDAILVEVPPGAGSGGASCDETSCTYGYDIVVDDVGMLDPRVRVTN